MATISLSSVVPFRESTRSMKPATKTGMIEFSITPFGQVTPPAPTRHTRGRGGETLPLIGVAVSGGRIGDCI